MTMEQDHEMDDFELDSQDGESLLPNGFHKAEGREAFRSRATRRIVCVVLCALTLGLLLYAVGIGLVKLSLPWLLHDDPYNWGKPSVARGRHGAVASELGICSGIGIDVLRGGGNVVDAAIASLVCVGSINMHSTGLGGGGFMLVSAGNGSSTSFNFREAAPAAAGKHMYDHDPMAARVGGLAVAVPGEVSGLWEAHQAYGALPWKDLFAPSIKLCREGFIIPSNLAEAIQKTSQRFLTDPSWSFMVKDGRVLKEGDRLVRSAYADTLEAVATNGPKAFYSGFIAESIVNHVNATGGILTLQDMLDYSTIVREPVSSEWLGKQVLTCPAPTSGPVLIEALNIIEGFQMDESPLSYHRIVETMKWLSAGRTELGDPNSASWNNSARVTQLMSKDWARQVQLNFSDTQTFHWKHYQPAYQGIENAGTTHLSAVSEDGMAVAVTSTVNLYFGAEVHDPVTGVILNSEMDDFSIPSTNNAYDLRPSIYNFAAPYKRPLSSTTPTIVLEKGMPVLVIGASGGSRIVTSVFEAMVRHHRLNHSIVETMYAPRMHHQLLPEHISLEYSFPERLRNQLFQFGHESKFWTPQSVVQVIARAADAEFVAVSDPRKQGISAAY